MKPAMLQVVGKIIICIIAGIVCGSGCTYRRHHWSLSAGMPEEMYIAAPVQNYYTPSIAICGFQAPGHPRGVGSAAATLLHSALSKNDFAAKFSLDATFSTADTGLLSSFARDKKYDFIITGRILYCLDGGISTDSRVEEEIRIYRVLGRELDLVGSAKASETVSPLSSFDFILVQGIGEAAPSTSTLMKRNAEKFARFLSTMFPEHLPSNLAKR